MTLTLKTLDLDVSVMKFPLDTKLSADFINAAGFKNIVRTHDELTVICETAGKPAQTPRQCVDGWRAFMVEGPLDFSLTGILNSIAAPLAENSISIMAISTFDTDYVLVANDNFEKAKTVLAKSFKVV